MILGALFTLEKVGYFYCSYRNARWIGQVDDANAELCFGFGESIVCAASTLLGQSADVQFSAAKEVKGCLQRVRRGPAEANENPVSRCATTCRTKRSALPLERKTTLCRAEVELGLNIHFPFPFRWPNGCLALAGA
jgi:hypothetical protein